MHKLIMSFPFLNIYSFFYTVTQITPQKDKVIGGITTISSSFDLVSSIISDFDVNFLIKSRKCEYPILEIFYESGHGSFHVFDNDGSLININCAEGE